MSAPRHVLSQLALAAALLTVIGHISWILVPDAARDALTIATVMTFAAAGVLHAACERGIRWAATFAGITLVVGWIAEAVGTTSGLPFGQYTYADSLGPKLGPVPLVIPLAWTMMAYPVLLAARRVASSGPGQILYAAALLTAWDLFLDPQMVAEGHWVWAEPAPALPGIPGIPAQNFAGWFLVGLILFSICAALLPQQPHDRVADDRLPAAMLLWITGSNILASAVFWDRPSVAVIGGTVMGALVLIWLRSPGVRSDQLRLPDDLPAELRSVRRRLVHVHDR